MRVLPHLPSPSAKSGRKCLEATYLRSPSLKSGRGSGGGVWLLLTLLFAVLLLSALPVLAQEGGVTEDEVNAVAQRLFCPVCENIPLDVCGTPACLQWRAEIRTQLEQGQTPDEIVTDFVQRFGERVVGTPQDPTLRALSLLTPWLLAGLALVVAVETLLRWRRKQAAAIPAPAAETPLPKDDATYRERIEADLRARR